MVSCKVTRHLNGVIKFIVIKDDDDTLVINMDKVVSIFFNSGDTDTSDSYSPFRMTIQGEENSEFYTFRSRESFIDIKNTIENELLK